MAVAAHTIYAVDDRNQLVSIDDKSLAVTRIAALGVLLTDLAIAPDGTLYGVSYTDLYKIDPATGALTRVAGLTGAGDVNSFVINGSGQAFIGRSDAGGLYTLDLTTGAVTQVGTGNAGVMAGGDMVTSGGSVFMTTADNQLAQFDQKTGALLSEVGSNVGNVYALAGDGGLVYAFSGSVLYSLNLSTGQYTKVADFSGTLGVVFGAASFDFGANVITGTAGADRLVGTTGDDILTGGLGADTLTGNGGHDIFRDTLAGLSGDTITDFNSLDAVNVTDAPFSSFNYSRIGTSLNLPGGTVTLSNNPVGHLLVSQDGGGVDLTLGAHVTGLQDFNGDGHSDLLFRNTASGTFTTWQITGNATANTETINTYVNASAPNTQQIQGTFDFNGDGASDIIFRDTTTGAFSVWTSSGQGFTQNAYTNNTVDNTFALAGIGDFNGDGKDDILWRAANGTFTIWQSTGTGFTPNVVVNTSVDASFHLQAVGDFNGDGKADLLWRASNGTFTIWSSTGAGFTPNTFVSNSVDSTWHIAAVADFNGDGKDDILFRNNNGTFTEWQSNGTGFAPNVYVNGTVDNGWTIVGAYDFNDDGKADLLFRNVNNGTFTIWQSTGNGFIPNVLVDGQVSNNWTLVTHHYDLV